MQCKYTLAKMLQLFAIPSAIVAFALFDWLDDLTALLAFLLIALPSYALPIFFKCSKCGANYFHDPRNRAPGLMNFNVLRPIREHCAKCGYDRAHLPDGRLLSL